MNPFNFFRAPSPSDWFSVGLTTAFPDLGHDDDNISQPRLCSDELRPGCKIFRVPQTNVAQRTEVSVDSAALDGLDASEVGEELKSQVLVFQYKGKFHAIDNVGVITSFFVPELRELLIARHQKCPHSSFPLSQGTPFDIEDFGVVLSAAVTCPKHNWSFDLFTGLSDRAMYKLTVWEVQLRHVGASPPKAADGPDRNSDGTEKEVWVRRKPRMG